LALDVDPSTVAGRCLRHVPAGANPARRPEPPDDNRWQRGHVVDALYLADSEACVWAEWYRHLAERALPPQVALPRDLWRYDIASIEVADLTSAARLARVDLPLPQPGRRGWAAFQAVGEQLRNEGWRGLVAPSAARPTSRVLAVFVSNTGVPDEVRAVDRTRIDDPPAPPTGMRT
jgi:RES domain